jgi:hypothetical protein
MGQWIVGAVGLGVIGYAVYMFKHHAIDEKFMKRLSTDLTTVRTLGRDLGFHGLAVVVDAGYARRETRIIGIGRHFELFQWLTPWCWTAARQM